MLCRRLYAEDGRFEVGNIQDWQHSAMYMAFLLSGAVDLVAHRLPDGFLPEGVEHVSKQKCSLCDFPAAGNVSFTNCCMLRLTSADDFRKVYAITS